MGVGMLLEAKTGGFLCLFVCVCVQPGQTSCSLVSLYSVMGVCDLLMTAPSYPQEVRREIMAPWAFGSLSWGF